MRSRGLFITQLVFLAFAFAIATAALVCHALMIVKVRKDVADLETSAHGDDQQKASVAPLRLADLHQWLRLLYASVAYCGITIVYSLARIFVPSKALDSRFCRGIFILSALAAVGTGISVPLFLQQDWLPGKANQPIVVRKFIFGGYKCAELKRHCNYNYLGGVCGAVVPLLLLAVVACVSAGNNELREENRELSILNAARRAGEADAVMPFQAVASSQSHSDDGMGAPLIPGTTSYNTTHYNDVGTKGGYQKARHNNGAVVYPSNPASTAGSSVLPSRGQNKFPVPHTQAPAAWAYNGAPASAWSHTTQSATNTDMSERQESLLPPPSYPASDSNSTLRPSDSRSSGNHSNPNLLLRAGGNGANVDPSRPVSRVSTVSNFDWPDWVVAASSTPGSSARGTGIKF